jgi:uncharacterized protein (TIGR02757 family)
VNELSLIDVNISIDRLFVVNGWVFMKKNQEKIKALLDGYVSKYNTTSFIAEDPICIPHRFATKKDQEIAAFFAASFAWGQRITIINKTNELLKLMDDVPADFIIHHQESDRKRFINFKHRTFQYTDTLYFLDYLQRYYRQFTSLETAFLKNDGTFEAFDSISQFHNNFFDHPYAPERTKKHVATPSRKSTCKRLNMMLRWLCRQDEAGVDLGIWKRIPTERLMIPLDVHVEKTARKLGLLHRKQRDWQAVEELTQALRVFDPNDPVKYDYALFGLSIMDGKDY